MIDWGAVGQLNFNQEFLAVLAAHRDEFATKLFQFITFWGGVEGYLIIIALLYAAISKRLAVQAAIVVLLSAVANHLLKVAIQNPRPFVVDGSYSEQWAVSATRAAELAAEFSTPSGHAMGATSFYLFLMLKVQNNLIRALLVVAPVLIGISRPVLGVHYVEDILLGWVLGAGLAVLASRHIETLWAWWRAQTVPAQIAASLCFSTSVWLLTLWLTGRTVDDLPTEFVGILGFLTGALLAAPMEAKHIDDATKGTTIPVKLARFFLMAAVLVGGMLLLDTLMGLVEGSSPVIASFLRYLKYAGVAFASLFGAPWLFKGLKLRAAAT